jgi:hypothetical protein
MDMIRLKVFSYFSKKIRRYSNLQNKHINMDNYIIYKNILVSKRYKNIKKNKQDLKFDLT